MRFENSLWLPLRVFERLARSPTHAAGNIFCCCLDCFICNHLHQAVNRSVGILVVCRDSVGIHCRAEEEEADQHLPQLDRQALFLVLSQNEDDLHGQVCRDHCEEGVSLPDERVALVVPVIIGEES